MLRPKSFSRFNFILVFAVLTLHLTAAITQGQTASHTREPQRNFTPAGSFSLTDFESINTTNGNLIFRYPLGQLPAGRSAMRGGFHLQYNSKLYDTFIGQSTDITGATSLQNLLRDTTEGGWKLRYRYDLSVTNRNNEIDGGYEAAAFIACQATGSSTEQNELATYIWKVKLRFPDGSEHLFRPSGYADGRGDGYFNVDTLGNVRAYGCSVPPGSTGCGCSYTQSIDPNPRMTYYSTDGSYLRLTVERNQDWTLYYPDGSKVFNQGPLQRVSDRNGNYYDIAFNTIYDNTGRSTSLTYDSATGDDLITQTGVGNTPLVWRIKWKTISIVNKGYSSTAASAGQQQGNTAIQQWTSDYRVVDKIVLPTQLGNLSYTFNYNTATGWAEVSSVIMPADASETPPQVAYQYTYPGGLANGLPRCTNILRGYPSNKTLTWQAQANGITSPVTETSLYNIGNTLTYVTSTDSGVTTELHGDTSTPAVDTGLVKRIERPDGSKTERIYALNPQPWLGFLPPTMSERNAFVKTEFTSIKNAGGSYAKTAIKDFSYDKNGNVLQVTEYDWVDYNLVPKDGNQLPTGIPGGAALKRVSLNTYNNATSDSSIPGNHANAYWNLVPTNGYTSLVLNAVASKEVRPTVGGTIQARTEYTYDNPATTANLTITRSWDSAKGAINQSPAYSTWIATTNQYGTYFTGTTGKLIKTFDANNVATSYTYGDIGNGTTDLYVTKTIAAETAAVARTSESKYDFYTGAATEAKDTDNNVITQTTLDVFGRPTLIQEAFGIAGQERRTAIEYSDTLRRVITRADLSTTGDAKLVQISHYDQLGRIRLSRTLENAATQSATNETHGTKVQSRYLYHGSNRYELVSAPYAASDSNGANGEPGMAWKRVKYDNGSKVIELETFSGSALPAPWGTSTASSGKVVTLYDAEATTVIDQAKKVRRSLIDGLGQLVRVDEPTRDFTTAEINAAAPNLPNPTLILGAVGSPNQKTEYAYNVLDNLTSTAQTGIPNGGTVAVTQARTFNYSTLGRLISAINPESGLMQYLYDNNGNLLRKTDARGVFIDYTYDALNRNLTANYSNTSVPDITRVYDPAIPYGKGRLWYSYAGGNETPGAREEYRAVTSYDALGRSLSVEQWFKETNNAWNGPFTSSQTYDLAENVKTKTYPSGRTTTNTYDNEGKLTQFTGNLGGGTLRTYSTGITYNAQGQMLREQFGTTTTLFHNRHYNRRGQLFDARLGTSGTDEWSWNRGALRMYFNSDNSDYNATPTYANNNGNLYRQDHFVPDNDAISSWSMSVDYYDYDAVNRVKFIAEHTYRSNGANNYNTFSQYFSYDRFGNRLISSMAGVTGVPNPGFKINGPNNRLIAPTDVNGVTGSDKMQYDLAGNLIKDAHTQAGTGTRTYDAENRMLTAIGTNGQTQTYVYDADGRRTRRILNNGSDTWWQVYGVGGEMVAEYQLVSGAPALRKEYGHRNGQLLVITDATNNTCQWLVTDALGTPRIIADQTGSLSAIKRRDYLPFGEEVFANVGHRATTNGYATAAAQQPRQQFTGKDRDNETGLDYFEARYYGSLFGRFTSPDEFTGGPDELYDFAGVAANNPTFYADLIDPQSLNKYQYCYNNPLSYVDIDGHKGLRAWARQAAEAAADFVGGVARGTGASLTFGYCTWCNPNSNDSIASRAGQVLGTAVVGAGGTSIAGAGGAALVVSGGTAAALVAPVAAVAGGAVLVAGAAKNVGPLATTPIRSQANSQQSGGREGKNFTPNGKKQVIQENAQANNGGNKCTGCKVETVPAQQSKKGVTPPTNENAVDHVKPKSKGGSGTPDNGQLLCRKCNGEKSDKLP